MGKFAENRTTFDVVQRMNDSQRLLYMTYLIRVTLKKLLNAIFILLIFTGPSTQSPVNRCNSLFYIAAIVRNSLFEG